MAKANAPGDRRWLLLAKTSDLGATGLMAETAAKQWSLDDVDAPVVCLDEVA